MRQRAPGGSPRVPGSGNPFAAPEPALVVADAGPAHRCLLNKYPVLSRHLLIITRAFEPQERLLTAADLAAVWPWMIALGGLTFYNGGPVAGASQGHKHLQVIPLPLLPGEVGVPIFERAGAFERAGLPFRHVSAVPGARPASAHAAYLEALEAAGCRGRDGYQARPYNLLLTTDRLLVVPRVAERWRGISVNALGFAGALLVRDAPAGARLRAAGPMAALTELAG